MYQGTSSTFDRSNISMNSSFPCQRNRFRYHLNQIRPSFFTTVVNIFWSDTDLLICHKIWRHKFHYYWAKRILSMTRRYFDIFLFLWFQGSTWLCTIFQIWLFKFYFFFPHFKEFPPPTFCQLKIQTLISLTFSKIQRIILKNVMVGICANKLKSSSQLSKSQTTLIEKTDSNIIR